MLKISRKLFLGLAITIFLTIQGTYLAEAGQFQQLGKIFRGMSMGNTGVSSAHDNDAIFYNPASLPNIQRNMLDILSIQFNTTPSTVGGVFENLSNPKKAANLISPSQILESILEKNNGVTNQGYLAMTSGNYQAIDRGWNVAGSIFLEGEYLLNIDGSNINKIATINLRSDIGAIAAFSYPFNYGEYAVGIATKIIRRNAGNFTYSTAEAIAGKKPPVDNFQTKYAIGFDAGFLMRIPGPLRFRAGVSLLNILGLNFGDKDYDWPQELNFGMAIGPNLFDRWRLIAAFDYRDILFKNGANADGSINKSLLQRTHLGVELGYFVERKTFALLNLRAGLNQGIITLGAEMNFLLGRTIVVGVTLYGENIADNIDLVSNAQKKTNNLVIYISAGI